MKLTTEDTFRDRELRRHARVDDAIVLFWREVKLEEIPKELVRPEEPIDFFPLSAQLRLLGLEAAELLDHIEQRNPLLAEYLRILERKIDMLSCVVTANDNSHLTLSTRHVNISASGLSFLTEVQYPVGALLELKMYLPATQVGIIAYGRVIHYIPYVEGEPHFFRIGVDFILIQDHDRKLLIHHVERRKALYALFQEQPESL